jgi:serine O-acetyltransferase
MFKTLKRDIQVVKERDPACRGTLEVIFCYPGFHVLFFYRSAHWMWNHGMKLAARMVSQAGRSLTGIEIHPGAKIGPGFFVDHGMGVVIGETAEIGENVTLYHGVTLGGTSWKKEKRHPTIGNNVVIGTGAKVLGPFTVGENSRIGAGSVVVNEVPPDSVVVGIPGRVTHRGGKRVLGEIDLEQHELPDPVAKAIECILDRIHHMEHELNSLKSESEERKQ